MTNFSDVLGLHLPAGFKLRDWQKRFLTTFLNKCVTEKKSSFLLEACPAAGKSIGQMCPAYILRNLGLIKWTTVVVPTDHLRTQMGVEIYKIFGLDLYYGTDRFAIEDYQGEVITYAQLAANPNLYKARCALFGNRVMVVGDEIHHLGEKNSWGQAFKTAFSDVAYRLLTSGTPFRSDNQKILGDCINYKLDQEGNYISVPDFRIVNQNR